MYDCKGEVREREREGSEGEVGREYHRMKASVHPLSSIQQYNMIINGDSTSIRSFANLPLWIVEGMAEYLSIGRVDAHTAMWMRDAVLSKDIPKIKDLTNPKYFPYRYGQAFWAFLTGIYGDEVIRPFFMSTAKYGLLRKTQRSKFTHRRVIQSKP